MTPQKPKEEMDSRPREELHKAVRKNYKAGMLVITAGLIALVLSLGIDYYFKDIPYIVLEYASIYLIAGYGLGILYHSIYMSSILHNFIVFDEKNRIKIVTNQNSDN
jgi:hypothetical protein